MSWKVLASVTIAACITCGCSQTRSTEKPNDGPPPPDGMVDSGAPKIAPTTADVKGAIARRPDVLSTGAVMEVTGDEAIVGEMEGQPLAAGDLVSLMGADGAVTTGHVVAVMADKGTAKVKVLVQGPRPAAKGDIAVQIKPIKPH